MTEAIQRNSLPSTYPPVPLWRKSLPFLIGAGVGAWVVVRSLSTRSFTWGSAALSLGGALAAYWLFPRASNTREDAPQRLPSNEAVLQANTYAEFERTSEARRVTDPCAHFVLRSLLLEEWRAERWKAGDGISYELTPGEIAEFQKTIDLAQFELFVEGFSLNDFRNMFFKDEIVIEWSLVDAILAHLSPDKLEEVKAKLRQWHFQTSLYSFNSLNNKEHRERLGLTLERYQEFYRDECDKRPFLGENGFGERYGLSPVNEGLLLPAQVARITEELRNNSGRLVELLKMKASDKVQAVLKAVKPRIEAAALKCMGDISSQEKLPANKHPLWTAFSQARLALEELDRKVYDVKVKAEDLEMQLVDMGKNLLKISQVKQAVTGYLTRLDALTSPLKDQAKQALQRRLAALSAEETSRQSTLSETQKSLLTVRSEQKSLLQQKNRAEQELKKANEALQKAMRTPEEYELWQKTKADYQKVLSEQMEIVIQALTTKST